MQEFFERHLKDLALADPVKEPNSNVIIVRLKEVYEGMQFMISYKKKTYASAEEAKKDSVLNAQSG
jgi:hypothetical protein